LRATQAQQIKYEKRSGSGNGGGGGGGGDRALPQPNSPARTLLKALPRKCAFSDYRFYLLPLSGSARAML